VTLKKINFQLDFTAGIFIAAIAVKAFKALGVYPEKIATLRIRTQVGGFLAL